MDIASVATGLARSSLSLNLNAGVLDALQNLDKNVAARLAASIGLGRSVDAYA